MKTGTLKQTARKDSQQTTVRTGQPGNDSKNRTARTEQQGQDREDRTARTARVIGTGQL
jgi:hypothetical protein